MGSDAAVEMAREFMTIGLDIQTDRTKKTEKKKKLRKAAWLASPH